MCVYISVCVVSVCILTLDITDRDGLNELYAATRKQLNSEMELRQVHDAILYT